MYEMTSVTTKTSNADLVKMTLNVERVSRGVYALSGEVYVNVDIEEGDNNEVKWNYYYYIFYIMKKLIYIF